MNIQPFLNATPTVQLHAATAIMAFALGLYLLIARKGDARHRFLGKVWIGLMVISALSALAISQIKTWGYFSPIHFLVPYTLWGVFDAVSQARNKNASAHKKSIIGLFSGALIGAGLFTFLPGRVMSDIFFARQPWFGFGAMALVGVLITAIVIWINFSPRLRSQ